MIIFIKKIPIIGSSIRFLNRKRIYYKNQTLNFFTVLKRNKLPNMLRELIPESLGMIYLKTNFFIFQPNGGGTDKMLTPLHVKSINQTIPLLEKIAGQNNHEEKQIITSEQFRKLFFIKEIEANDSKLAALFTKYGSDKTKHEYHLIYSVILSVVKPKCLLEIGMGTNNEKVFSNMSKYGHPGASLRAFRDFLPSTEIYGADIDKEILFKEERINTFYVDQTNKDTLDKLAKNISNDIDIIIDDGLHAPNANLQTLMFALEQFNNKKNKWLIIEDIRIDSVVIYKLLTSLIDTSLYKTYIVRTKRSHVFVCHKYF